MSSLRLATAATFLLLLLVPATATADTPPMPLETPLVQTGEYQALASQISTMDSLSRNVACSKKKVKVTVKVRAKKGKNKGKLVKKKVTKKKTVCKKQKVGEELYTDLETDLGQNNEELAAEVGARAEDRSAFAEQWLTEREEGMRAPQAEKYEGQLAALEAEGIAVDAWWQNYLEATDTALQARRDQIIAQGEAARKQLSDAKRANAVTKCKKTKYKGKKKTRKKKLNKCLSTVKSRDYEVEEVDTGADEWYDTELAKAQEAVEKQIEAAAAAREKRHADIEAQNEKAVAAIDRIVEKDRTETDRVLAKMQGDDEQIAAALQRRGEASLARLAP